MIKILSQLDTLEAEWKAATTNEFEFPHINKAPNGEVSCFKTKMSKEEVLNKYTKDMSKAIAGDMVAFVNGMPIILDGSFAFSGIRNIVEGVVVIPSSHTNNGRPVIMSLNEMSCVTPEQGTDKMEYMYWGGYNIETPLKNYTHNYGYFPVDKEDTYSGDKYPSVDGGFYFHKDNQFPSPYKSDGSKNNAFFADNSKCYSDFNGKSNTDTIIGITKYGFDGEIPNEYGQGHYPAFMACHRYQTEHIGSGEWYLPSIGELAYMRVRQGAINDTLSKLGALTLGCYGKNGRSYWSSTEYSAATSWYCLTGNGYCGNYYKGSSGFARAFHAL